MPDVTKEFLQQLQGLIERAVGGEIARSGGFPEGGHVGPLSSFEMATDQVFATGYSGGLTTLPFTADISEAGGGGGFAGTDVVTM